MKSNYIVDRINQYSLSGQSDDNFRTTNPIRAAYTRVKSSCASISKRRFFVHDIGSGCFRTSQVQFHQPEQEASGLPPVAASHPAPHCLAPPAAYEASVPTVLVAVPTFRRPELLRRLLAAVARLETDAQVQILIADNDVDGQEGRHAAEALRMSGYRFPIHVIVVPGTRAFQRS